MRPATVALFVALLLFVPVAAAAPGGGPEPDPAPAVAEVELGATLEQVWDLFATADGWKALGVAKARVDFRVGGKILTTYDPQATLGDEHTIENTILAYEPLRTFAFQATRAPKGFPFPQDVLDRMWSVVTLNDLGEGRTRLTLRGYGYGTDEASRQMRAFFERGNAEVLEHLASRYPPPHADGADDALDPIEATAVVAGSQDEVFRALSTAEGWKAFLGVEARIDLAPGGRFEILFVPNAPEGRRGSEGCTVQSWLPGRMLSFTWNAPPKFPHARAARTLVVLELETEAPGRTRVRLTHEGFADRAAADPDRADEWRQTRAYFANAWPQVLGGLQEHFAQAK